MDNQNNLAVQKKLTRQIYYFKQKLNKEIVKSSWDLQSEKVMRTSKKLDTLITQKYLGEKTAL